MAFAYDCIPSPLAVSAAAVVAVAITRLLSVVSFHRSVHPQRPLHVCSLASANLLAVLRVWWLDDRDVSLAYSREE